MRRSICAKVDGFADDDALRALLQQRLDRVSDAVRRLRRGRDPERVPEAPRCALGRDQGGDWPMEGGAQ